MRPPAIIAALALSAIAAHGAVVIGTGGNVIGTRNADVLIGTGRPGDQLVGGDGNDQLRGGIPSTPPTSYLNLYGGVFLPSRAGLDPDATVFGQPGAIGGLHNDGNDWVDGGCGYRSKGGSGADTYQNHGFGCASFPFETLFDAPLEGDRFIFNVGPSDADHPMGFKIDNIDYTEITKNGKPFLRVNSFTLEMTGPLHQTQIIGFADDKRGPASAHLVDVPRGPLTVTRPNAIRAMIYAAATPGRQPADLAGAPAQWIFPIR
jgi:hypothetical protein